MEDKEFLRIIGQNIVRLRKDKNLTQLALADLIEMEDSSLRRIENGRINSSILILKKVAKALQVQIYDIVPIIE